MSAAKRSRKRNPAETGNRSSDVASASDVELDDALENTFPASDPPAQTQAIVRVGIKTTNDARRQSLAQR
jgi:hypothetical protein